MEEFRRFFSDAAGLSANDVWMAAASMAARVVIVYLLALLLARLAGKRFAGPATVFDLFIAVAAGVMAGIAVAGLAPFPGTLAALVALAALHAAVRGGEGVRGGGGRAGGSARVLVRDGKVLWGEMRRNRVSELELLAALKRHGGLTNPNEVRLATLEPDGDITVIPKRPVPPGPGGAGSSESRG